MLDNVSLSQGCWFDLARAVINQNNHIWPALLLIYLVTCLCLLLLLLFHAKAAQQLRSIKFYLIPNVSFKKRTLHVALKLLIFPSLASLKWLSVTFPRVPERSSGRARVCACVTRRCCSSRRTLFRPGAQWRQQPRTAAPDRTGCVWFTTLHDASEYSYILLSVRSTGITLKSKEKTKLPPMLPGE